MAEKQKVTIEFCTSWGYLAKAASLAEQILHDHVDKVSEVTLIPSSGGVHEVTFGETVLHSKKETGNHPDPDDVLARFAG